MKIIIKENAKSIYMQSNRRSVNWEWAEKIEKLQGKTLEVETEFLFNNQFNTAPNEVSEKGMRIMEVLVSKVIDDARIGKQRCSYCGKVSEIKGNEKTCPHCNESDHLETFHVNIDYDKFYKDRGYDLFGKPIEKEVE